MCVLGLLEPLIFCSVPKASLGSVLPPRWQVASQQSGIAWAGRQGLTPCWRIQFPPPLDEISMITFLLQHRTKPQLLSRAWVHTWLKRVWTLPALLGYFLQSLRWRMKGAMIAPSTVIAQLTVHGDAGNLTIGKCCCLGITRMQSHARIQIGNCVVINDGVRLITGSHDIHSPTYDHVFTPIVIEDYAWIATDAMILKGVTIGRGAVVAAGAVVVKNVRPFSVVGGNPAREISSRNIESFNYIPSSWFAPVMAWVGRNPAIEQSEPEKGATVEPTTMSLPTDLLPH